MVRTALVLANDERGLQQIFGLPVVRRLVLLMHRAGIEEVQVVSREESIFAALSDLIPPEAFHMVRDPAELDNVVGKINIGQGEGVLIARADLVVDRRSISTFVQAPDRFMDGCSTYALAPCERADTEAIYAVGKDVLSFAARAIWSPDQSGLTILDRAEQLAATPGLPCGVGSENASVRTAEDRLVTALPSATVDRDGFMARHVDRHVSLFISRRLAHTPVSPNGVTLFNVAVGLAGAFLLSRGGYWSQLIGTLSFLLCVVLDGVDGEIARLKLQETVFGHYLDIITDNIVHLAIFIGLGVGLYFQTGNKVYLYLLWVLLGGFAFCAAAVYKVSRVNPDKPRPRTVERLTGLLANRDFAYLLVALAIIGRLSWFLIGSAVGSYLFAVLLLALDLGERGSPARC